MNKLFKIIDNKIGREPTYKDLIEIVHNEEWAKGLVWTDIDGWVVDEYGSVLLMDDCGNVRYAPNGRFSVVWESHNQFDRHASRVLKERKNLFKKLT